MHIQFKTGFRRFITFILVTACLSPITLLRAETRTESNNLRILDLENSGDPIGKYVTEVLRLAIKKSSVNYVISKMPAVTTPQVRLIEEMSHNRGDLDVMWTMTSDERETQLLPIRIPIDKGLMGWRISFINAELRESMKAIKDIKQLAKFKAGQGYFWPDTTILRHNGLPVVTGTAAALPSMLQQRRFDYFPRSIIEIWNEQNNHPEYVREIDSNIVLHYPTALYFFVAPEQKKLADDIKRGLELAITDGSFEQLFNQYCKPFIVKANMKNRVILELKNPLIQQSKLPLQRPELWFDPT
ncbi:hypothetical protein H8K35_14795 [Undibacterium sp. LX40W]|uniref:Solute-binding protein family 3/N-terminal domain-containing protein n=1 Tax=Undibacterium nitidum TaxID=2762298 RepID=A0A923HQD9_9BURK|nr:MULTISPECIES: hypothetical protein [Undibacterium]MBC3882658.1 hypothetical protein [Undibacterium nitidum]MBC3892939.1 hypothetical protein [Undibacterium sp. LX40W]